MDNEPSLTDTAHIRTVEALQRAIDQAYRRLMETARADWNRLFAGQDPSDESVRIRISNDEVSEELAGIPRAALEPARRRSTRSRSGRQVR